MVWINPANVSGLDGFLQWIDQLTGNWFGNVILIVIWITLLLLMKSGFTFSRAFASSSTVAAILSVFLFSLGILNPVVMYFMIVMSIIGLIALTRESR